jgi:predicted DNA-binding transcriptional regulator YafY
VRAARPKGFDLARTWASTVEATEQRERWGTDLTVLAEEEDRRVLVELAAAMPEMIAAQLAGWGARIDVIAPDAVREHLARIGAELAERYGRSVAT